jgi:hypothetical protein
MSFTLPYDSDCLNIEYLKSRNVEGTYVSLFLTIVFVVTSVLSYKIYNNVIYSYNRKLGIYKKILEIYNTQYTGIKDLDKIVHEYNKLHVADVDDTDVDDTDATDTDATDTDDEVENCNTRVLRSDTRTKSKKEIIYGFDRVYKDGLDICGNGWRMD